jgi:hypothetical protein
MLFCNLGYKNNVTKITLKRSYIDYFYRNIIFFYTNCIDKEWQIPNFAFKIYQKK